MLFQVLFFLSSLVTIFKGKENGIFRSIQVQEPKALVGSYVGCGRPTNGDRGLIGVRTVVDRIFAECSWVKKVYLCHSYPLVN